MIRQLRPGEPLPKSEPRRYTAASGYIRLRWLVGPGEHVETYEHRVDGDRVTTAPQVHHRNHLKDDNRPENLVPVTTAEHGEHHRQIDDQDVARRYLAGASTIEVARVLGITPGAVSRSLKRSGTPARSGAPNYLTHITVEEVKRRYLSGEGLEHIASDMGCSVQAVITRLDKAGVKRRRPGRPPSNLSSAVLKVERVSRHYDYEREAS